MFIAYLDSSGRPDFDDKENFVLATVITNEANWQVIDNALKRIKLSHFPSLPDMEVEIHAKDMLNRHGIFKDLKWEQIYAIFDDVFRYVSLSDSALTIIAVVIDKKKLQRNQDIETWAYRLMFERINRFVERQNELLHAAQYFHQYGIMILDSEGEKKDQKLRRKLYSMLKDGTFYSKLTCLIEDPLFTDSKWRNLSQLVDCIAYCVRKKFRQNTDSEHTKHWDEYFKLIESKFDAPFGKYEGYGLKVFPENTSRRS